VSDLRACSVGGPATVLEYRRARYRPCEVPVQALARGGLLGIGLVSTQGAAAGCVIPTRGARPADPNANALRGCPVGRALCRLLCALEFAAGCGPQQAAPPPIRSRSHLVTDSCAARPENCKRQRALAAAEAAPGNGTEVGPQRRAPGYQAWLELRGVSASWESGRGHTYTRGVRGPNFCSLKARASGVAAARRLVGSTI